MHQDAASRPAARLTLADWQRDYRDGASPAALLEPLRSALASLGRPVYLHVAEAASLEARCGELEAVAATFDDRTALQCAQPLWGVPFVVKDNIDVAGEPTSAACPAFVYRAERHATVVQRLLDAGAVWLAKTNLDQFATGLVGTRSPYGAPASAWSDAHVSGGSSSGSAVAVALGHVPFALGTDTAGSGRVPAGFNHVVGLKPTPGRVANTGVLPACRTLDCVAVFALQVDDAARVLALIEGPDADDPYSRVVAGPAAWPAPARIGIPAPLPDTVDADVAAAFERTVAALRGQGHAIVPLDFGVLDEVAALLYDGPWVAERHLVVRELLAAHPDALDATVRRVIEAARHHSADDAFAARYRLQALAQRAERLWVGCDVLLVPTAPTHPTFDAVRADPVGANAALGRFTNFVNLLGWCALALPAEVSAAGLPLGVTLIARAGHDAALVRFGRYWQALARQPLGTTGRAYAKAALDAMPAAGAMPAVEPALPVAVVGAHLSGLPLNHQLTELGAFRLETTQTAPRYRLYALPGTTPPKPGLLRVGDNDNDNDAQAGGAAEPGRSIAVEVWSLPLAQVGRFLAGIASPLGLGSVELADGRFVHGFVCEPFALAQAEDVSRFGGWRAYLDTLAPPVSSASSASPGSPPRDAHPIPTR